MSKKYQYFAKKRNSFLYTHACDLSYCKFKKSHIYTNNCFCCLDKYTGRTRFLQQNAKQNTNIQLKKFNNAN